MGSILIKHYIDSISKKINFFISLIGCFWLNYFKERSENITLWKEGINKNGKCVFVIFLDILSILYWD